MRRNIILINGKKRSGKDFTANILKQILAEQGYSVETYAFAQPLKEITAELFNINLEQLDEYKNNPHKYQIGLIEDGVLIETLTDFRKVLNDLGTPILKSRFGEDIWTNLTRDLISKSKADYIIIPDFRFPVEFTELKQKPIMNYETGYASDYTNITTLRIERAGLPDSDLISENSLNDFLFDYYVENTGEGDYYLKKQLNNIIKEITEGAN